METYNFLCNVELHGQITKPLFNPKGCSFCLR